MTWGEGGSGGGADCLCVATKRVCMRNVLYIFWEVAEKVTVLLIQGLVCFRYPCIHESKILSHSLNRRVVTENLFSILILVRLPGSSLNSSVCF